MIQEVCESDIAAPALAFMKVWKEREALNREQINER